MAPRSPRHGHHAPAEVTANPTRQSVVEERRLDLRGLRCPMPVLRARKALRRMQAGEVIVLECTDPLAAIDIPHFVAEAGHVLTSSWRAGDILIFRIVHGG